MDYHSFRDRLLQSIAEVIKGPLFVVAIDRDKLWETYLESFPAEMNPMYRKRREYDCSTCRRFIKQFGHVVTIDKDNKVRTIWDFNAGDENFQKVINALSKAVSSSEIEDVFMSKEAILGAEKSHEQKDDGSVHTYSHYYVKLPKQFVNTSSDSIGAIKGAARDVRNVLKRSLDELSEDSVNTVLELIAQKSLYKGEEWEGVLQKFLTLKRTYANIKPELRANYCWRIFSEVGPVIGKIRNHSIGVLLQDISADMDLDEAVKKYEAIVAPTNYKRPKAVFTKKMIEEAQKMLSDLGLVEALPRRFAMLSDITVNNILFANRDVSGKIAGSVFDDLKGEVAQVSPKSFSKLEEVPIDRFISEVLPKISSMEVLLDNSHAGNLVSLIAPQNRAAPSLLKWNNNFSWAYQGNITDSMKERVKAAGGRVDGVLRFSIQWNENKDNEDDLDAHCIEPAGGTHIYFGCRGIRHRSSGMLDVDIVNPGGKVAVENITWLSRESMPKGQYRMYVHCYHSRGARSGFSAEVEFDGQIYSFSHPRPLRQGQEVEVAVVQYNSGDGFKIVKSMDHSVSSRQIWGIQTNQFHPVQVLMYSPNYWDAQTGIGNKHFFFMLKGCKNDGTPNGFFNEFLSENLMKHKRVFEALGSKMRVEPSEEQLSGLGFSSTQRNALVCKVSGSFNRMIKIVF